MTAHETVIAIDFGLRNLGIAVGNTLSNTARPLAVINARDGNPDWEALIAPERVATGTGACRSPAQYGRHRE